jgi:hypothetical protein
MILLVNLTTTDTLLYYSYPLSAPPNRHACASRPEAEPLLAPLASVLFPIVKEHCPVLLGLRPAIAGSVLLVELTGIEPVTSWLQTRRSPN